jgi:hypothetical protein
MSRMNLDSSVGYGLDDRGSIPVRGWEFLSSPPRPDWLWGPSSLPSNGHHGFLPWGGKAAGSWGWPHRHQLPRSRMRGAIPLLPNTPSWRGAQLKTNVRKAIDLAESRTGQFSNVNQFRYYREKSTKYRPPVASHNPRDRQRKKHWNEER